METAPSPQALSNGAERPFDSGLIRDKMQVGVDLPQSNSSYNKNQHAFNRWFWMQSDK